MAFILFRDKINTMQGILLENKEKNISREMVKYTAKVPVESIVDVYGKVLKAETFIKSATFHEIEFSVEKLLVVSASEPKLPFQLDNAAQNFVAKENVKFSFLKLSKIQ